MSCLSLPADELSRLQIIIKLQPTMLGQMSFRLQSQPLPDASPASTAAPLSKALLVSAIRRHSLTIPRIIPEFTFDVRCKPANGT